MDNKEIASERKALIFNIQRYSTEDGPGVRTTVFFQGCPLRCLWCSNPESKQHKPQMLYFENTCTECYSCLKVCPNGANQKKDDGTVWVDRNLCQNCGACVEACPSNARSIAGRWMTVDEVYKIIDKDVIYYMNSDGGVTLGGGECTSQPEFVLELLDRCYQRGIHICLDTCGYAPWSILEKILQKVDLVLFDIKHLDPVKHKEFTGVDNRLILDNASKIRQMGKKIIIRLPLIPGYNDDEKNITAIGRFMKLWGLDSIDILPYHRLGVNKYHALGEEYMLENLPSLQKDNIKSKVKILESFGLKVNVV
ncbi:glycyl-radical enzyme activating protein [Candidatus Formimonas warabiya]|uniref:Glycyl-radical enzyme activating protein n=1 Tax=Formimonas warabiya TaxID=1761012 RepID=A0A3G1KUJ5_FORW1|nr:glycyl-radical enzyme activating protein [Candidatus Formimonas warabiya]ATW26173.1 glycyl-radical enzyme activating protein [Candidatus Formimonas warabiya]